MAEGEWPGEGDADVVAERRWGLGRGEGLMAEALGQGPVDRNA